MGIIIEHRNVKEVCETERMDAVVRPSFKCEPPCITAAKDMDLYRYIITTYYPDLTNDEGLPELGNSYIGPINLAKEKGLKSIVFPLIGSSCEEVAIEDVLRMALRGIRDGIEGSDIEVMLALDHTAEKRLWATVPEELKKEERTEAPKIRQTPERRISPHVMEAMVTTKTYNEGRWGRHDPDELPEELRSLKWCSSREEVGKILLEYLKKHGFSNKSRAWDEISIAISKGAFYNIFDPDIEGDVSKKSLLITCIGCGLSLEETEQVLDAGGYKFTPSTEDKVMKYVLKHSEEFKAKDKDALYACNCYLIGCKCPPMFEE